jgi:hypothetical protein
MNETKPFQIVFTKQVTFLDRTGTTLKVYEIGDKVMATFKYPGGHYITPMGGIYFDEAKLADGEEKPLDLNSKMD